MADTPRRKRKAKASTKSPAPEIHTLPLIPKTNFPSFATLTFNADEIHLLVTSLGAAVVAATEEDDDEVERMVGQAMAFIDATPADVISGLVDKLHLAHAATCPTAPQESASLT